MRLLLDTQVYLWYLEDSTKLPAAAKDRIAAAAEVYVSSASIWEASIKIGIGKLQADPEELVLGIEGSGFTELPISAAHAARVATLPRHHNDPFDRLLLAQAIEGPLALISSDAMLTEYTELVDLIKA